MSFDTAMRDATDTVDAAQFQAGAPLLLTINDAAERLGIGRTLMRALVAADEVESVKIGRLRRIPEDALGAYIHHLRTLGTAGHPEAV